MEEEVEEISDLSANDWPARLVAVSFEPDDGKRSTVVNRRAAAALARKHETGFPLPGSG
jgi:hypothetical protein